LKKNYARSEKMWTGLVRFGGGYFVHR